MLCAPVTYESDARHTLCVWWLLLSPAYPWYTMLGTGTPPARLRSCTGMNGNSLSAPAGDVGFQLLRNCDAAASSSSLLVSGAEYENCAMCSAPFCDWLASGDQVPNPYT